MSNIDELRDIEEAHINALRTAGATSTDKLLAMAGSKKGRKDLAASTSIDEKQILRWVNMADLFRIKGVARQYANLLEASGVDTVKELRNRSAANLHAKMVEVNNEKKLAHTTPTLKQVTDFVEQAKGMEPMVSH